ncbi:hypothetical protein B0J12DRAFT_3714 [Macrophomina phaseolina]|uniref:Uncharacterized protein n=1 Tax=Macrophomina phaseolina TaxID=35725 RepID=A0ABQ8GU22_9PEZI|nr:hypothetical protein B0J12DRAFT_3714 [Macrophomina phaseolina]
MIRRRQGRSRIHPEPRIQALDRTATRGITATEGLKKTGWKRICRAAGALLVSQPPALRHSRTIASEQHHHFSPAAISRRAAAFHSNTAGFLCPVAFASPVVTVGVLLVAAQHSRGTLSLAPCPFEGRPKQPRLRAPDLPSCRPLPSSPSSLASTAIEH